MAQNKLCDCSHDKMQESLETLRLKYDVKDQEHVNVNAANCEINEKYMYYLNFGNESLTLKHI